MKTQKIHLLILLCLFCFPLSVHAEDLTSSSFIVRDPVINTGAEFSLSAIFQMFSGGDTVTGAGSSDNFIDRLGFLYFPFATRASVNASPGNNSVLLSWSPSAAGLGYNILGYEVGSSTTSGGPYIYTNVGNVTSYIYGNLTAGTTYYFVVRTLNALGNVIATSSEVSGTPTAGGGGAGGGGSGGAVSPSPTYVLGENVIFEGIAYPGSKVKLFRAGKAIIEVPAGADASFDISLQILTPGTYNFGIQAEDNEGRKSTLKNYTLEITTGVTTAVRGIFLSPTISIDKIEVKRGDILTVLGNSAPQAEVTVVFNSGEPIIKKTLASATGNWVYKLDTLQLEMGNHQTKARSATKTDITTFSQSLAFKVGNTTVLKGAGRKGIRTNFDLNGDGKINLLDFSILAYWYRRSNPTELVDLNEDGEISLADFSILAFHWTG